MTKLHLVKKKFIDTESDGSYLLGLLNCCHLGKSFNPLRTVALHTLKKVSMAIKLQTQEKAFWDYKRLLKFSEDQSLFRPRNFMESYMGVHKRIMKLSITFFLSNGPT